MAVYELDIQDFLPLGQGDVHRPSAHAISQALALSQLATTQIKLENLDHLFSPSQQVAVRQAIANLSVSDYLTLYQQGAKTHAEHIIDFFFMWETARPVFAESIEHTLALTQSVAVVTTKATTNTLVMSQSVTYTSQRSKTVTQTLSLVSRASLWLPNKYTYSIDLPDLTGPNAPEC